MKALGWGLIVAFGGAILYLMGDWVVRALDGYFVDGEATIALVIAGAFSVLALPGVLVGVRLVTRANRTPPINHATPNDS